MSKQQQLAEHIKSHFGLDVEFKDMLTVEVPVTQLLTVCEGLRDHDDFAFNQLTDICGVDYSEYGLAQWRTNATTDSGFSRAKSVDQTESVNPWQGQRFAVVIHLLSLQHNHRIRLKIFLEDNITLPSVVALWPAANWFERECFDLFGIIFDGHPDLRRLLTDYGFKGHPFRKDFPLIGEVEMRYDAKSKRCVYEPVSIQPRINIPRVIRKDNRYHVDETEEPMNG